MALHRRDLQLNDKLYSLILPPVVPSLPLCNRAAVLIGPFMTLLVDRATIELLSDSNTPQQARLMMALGKLGEVLTKVDPVAAHQLMMDAVTLSHLTVDTQSISGQLDFERHFGEYRGEVYQVMCWCLWECVKDFFPQLGEIAQEIKTAAAASPSPTAGATTTG